MVSDKEIQNKQIGNRLKAVRSIYNEGIRFTVEQFAHLLDVTNEQLLNYEAGRSALPINVLIELHNRGINPVFILTGEEDILANNNTGNELRKKINSKNMDYNRVVKDALMSIPISSTLSLQTIKASAGRIKLQESTDIKNLPIQASSILSQQDNEHIR